MLILFFSWLCIGIFVVWFIEALSERLDKNKQQRILLARLEDKKRRTRIGNTMHQMSKDKKIRDWKNENS